jgi:antitoxin PrlF
MDGDAYCAGMKATMGERGQITIPKDVRDRLHLRPGQRLEVSEERGRVILVKALDDAALQRAFGTLRLPGSVDDIVDEMRGPADIPSAQRPVD